MRKRMNSFLNHREKKTQCKLIQQVSFSTYNVTLLGKATYMYGGENVRKKKKYQRAQSLTAITRNCFFFLISIFYLAKEILLYKIFRNKKKKITLFSTVFKTHLYFFPPHSAIEKSDSS